MTTPTRPPIATSTPKRRQTMAQIFGRIKVANLYWVDKTIPLDGYHFHGCRFDNCRLVYKRGNFKIEGCHIDSNCTIDQQE